MMGRSGTWLMGLIVMATIVYCLGCLGSSGGSSGGSSNSCPGSCKSSCTYYRSSNRVTCRGARGASASCTTKVPEVASDKQEKGPAPRGTYLIGQKYTNHGIDWYNLYPRSQSGSVYYDYYRVNPDTGRSHLGMHPGNTSWGCITVTVDSCWRNLVAKIGDSSASSHSVSATYWRTKTIQYVGTLTVV